MILSFYTSFKYKVNITFKRQQAILQLFKLTHSCFWDYNKDKTLHCDIRMDFNCVTPTSPPPPQGQRGLPGEQGFRGLPGPAVSDGLPFS